MYSGYVSLLASSFRRGEFWIVQKLYMAFNNLNISSVVKEISMSLSLGEPLEVCTGSGREPITFVECIFKWSKCTQNIELCEKHQIIMEQTFTRKLHNVNSSLQERCTFVIVTKFSRWML